MSLTQRDSKRLTIQTGVPFTPSLKGRGGVIPLPSNIETPRYSSRVILDCNIRHVKVKSFDQTWCQPPTTNHSSFYSKVYSREAETEKEEMRKVNFSSLPRISPLEGSPFQKFQKSPLALKQEVKAVQDHINKIRKNRVKFNRPFSIECLQLGIPGLHFSNKEFIEAVFDDMKSQVPSAFEANQSPEHLSLYFNWLQRKIEEYSNGTSSLKQRDFYKLGFCRLYYHLSSIDNLLAEELNLIFNKFIGIFEDNRRENEALRVDFERKTKVNTHKTVHEIEMKMLEKTNEVENAKLKIEELTRALKELEDEKNLYRDNDCNLRRQIDKFKMMAKGFQDKSTVFKNRYHRVMEKNLSLKLNTASKEEARLKSSASPNLKLNHPQACRSGSFNIEEEGQIVLKVPKGPLFEKKRPEQKGKEKKGKDSFEMPSESSIVEGNEITGFKEGLEAYTQNLERLDQMAANLMLVPNGKTFISHQETQTVIETHEKFIQTDISCLDAKYDGVLGSQSALDKAIKEREVRAIIHQNPNIKVALRIPEKPVKKKSSANIYDSLLNNNQLSPTAQKVKKDVKEKEGFSVKLERLMSPKKMSSFNPENGILFLIIEEENSQKFSRKKSANSPNPSLSKILENSKEEMSEDLIVTDEILKEKLRVEIELLKDSNSLFFLKILEAYKFEKVSKRELHSQHDFLAEIKSRLEFQNQELERKVSKLEKNLLLNQKKLSKVNKY